MDSVIDATNWAGTSAITPYFCLRVRPILYLGGELSSSESIALEGRTASPEFVESQANVDLRLVHCLFDSFVWSLVVGPSRRHSSGDSGRNSRIGGDVCLVVSSIGDRRFLLQE